MIDNEMDRYLAGDEMHDLPESRQGFIETAPFTVITGICLLLSIISCALIPVAILCWIGSKTWLLWFG